jgi:hypothetical protein
MILGSCCRVRADGHVALGRDPTLLPGESAHFGYTSTKLG